MDNELEDRMLEITAEAHNKGKRMKRIEVTFNYEISKTAVLASRNLQRIKKVQMLLS